MSCCSFAGGESEPQEKSTDEESEDKVETWSTFTQEVTMHGIRHVHLSNRHPAIKFLWLFTILVMIGYALIAIWGFLETFSRKETSTRFKNIRVRELQFPSVVICSNNAFNRTAVQQAISEQNYTGLDLFLEKVFTIGLSVAPVDWSLPKYSKLAQLSSSQMEKLLFDLVPSVEQSITAAYFQKVSLNITTEFKRIITDQGVCYQFNSDGKLKMEYAGVYNGLYMTLNADVDTYYSGPTSIYTGFVMAFYKPGEVPMIYADGTTGVTPGTNANIALDLIKIKRQPPPADNNTADCFDAENQPNFLSYYPEYSYNACIRECRANYSIANCGCRHIFEPAVGGAKICGIPTVTSCWVDIHSNPNTLKEYLENCECKNTCHEQHYKTQIALFNFPNEQFMKRFFNSSKESIEDMKRNLVTTMISYRSLSYDLFEEYIAYDWTDVIANLGGTLGVCIGASLLTICEFIQFGVNSLVRWCYRMREKRGKNSTQVHVLPAPAVTDKYSASPDYISKSTR